MMPPPLCPGNTNWRDLILSLHPDYPDALAGLELIEDWHYPGPAWDYIGAGDPDLIPAFNAITGIHYPLANSPLQVGNFKTFVKERIKPVYKKHGDHMLFYNGFLGSEAKEVWITEYNIKDEPLKMNDDLGFGKHNDNELEDFAQSIDNTFSHAVMLEHWFLWNLKANYDPAFRPNFLTRTMLQNYLGGSEISLMRPSNKVDRALLGISDCTEYVAITNEGGYNKDFTHYLRKPTYYSYQLFNVISKKHLKYLEADYGIYMYNDNIPPTVFLDLAEHKLYVYYTNVKQTTQLYAFDPGTLEDIYGPTIHIDLGTGTVMGHILDAQQTYSTYGNQDLFAINDAYSPCNTAITIPTRLSTIANLELPVGVTCPGGFTSGVVGGVCVSVPPMSLGYFEIPFTFMRIGEFDEQLSIYPNPTSSYFIIQRITTDEIGISEMNIKIYSLYGSIVKETTAEVGQSIDITELPVGVYTVAIYQDGKKLEVKKLIKMK